MVDQEKIDKIVADVLAGRSKATMKNGRISIRKCTPWRDVALVIVGVMIDSVVVSLCLWLILIVLKWLIGPLPIMSDYGCRLVALYELLLNALRQFDEDLRQDWKSIHLITATASAAMILLATVGAVLFVL